jgi:3-deoxy-D-manno-octulosonic-acid transferase
VILYKLAIPLLQLGIRIASVRNAKAKAWIEGRRDLFSRLDQEISPGDKVIWMHCASAGELEQGKSLAEALKSAYPGHKLLISFFSPSGFEAGKKYQTADITCYLPLDTEGNAKKFLDKVHPSLVIFIKYEYWHNHLKAIAERKIPLFLVSAIFRKEQAFFKWYGGFFRKLLGFFSWIFVQDNDSLEKLKSIGISQASVSGDTRFDRVLKIRENSESIPIIEQFIGDDLCFIAGSTWKEDEELFTDLAIRGLFKMIIAPHEINNGSIHQLKEKFPESILYSSLVQDPAIGTGKKILIIDNYGMLSRLYRYATISFIGGGFNKSGIHNTLEAAAWGMPVLFGPNYHKFREAREMVINGAGFSVATKNEFEQVIKRLSSDILERNKAGETAKKFVEDNAGATAAIMDHIQRNRLLTT